MQNGIKSAKSGVESAILESIRQRPIAGCVLS